MRPGRLVEYELADEVGHQRRGAERHERAVGMTDEGGRRADLAEQFSDVVAFVL